MTTETFVPVPGASIHTIDDGDGPPIVLLHAGIANLHAWDAMVPFLVAAGYRAIRYDARAFGESATEDVKFSNRADCVAVLDALGLGQAVLVGNSRGGQIAIDTAIEFPDRIAALVAVGTGPGGFDGGGTPRELELMDEGDALESAETLDADAIADFDVRLWVDGADQPTDRVPAAIREAVREMDRPQYLPDVVGGEPIPLDPTANDRLEDLRCPVLAIAGALDLSHMTAAAHRLVEAAPNARAVVWDDVAHMIGMEQPKRLADAIVEFLAPLPRWS